MKFEKWFYEDMTSGMIKDIDNITEDEMCSVKTAYVANLIFAILCFILFLFELLFGKWDGTGIILPIILVVPCLLRVVRLNELRKPMSDSRKMIIRKANMMVIAVLTIGCIVGTLLFTPSVAWKCIDTAFLLVLLFFAIGSIRHWKKVDEERKH